jgi:ubiquinone/menaquinone biosynthesis C-methylase UbiE
MSSSSKHPYEDPNYWSRRATREGVATLGWSIGLNEYYYSMKDKYVSSFLAKVPKGGKILDAGCGVARIGKYVRDHRPDTILIGIDFSDGMLKAASMSGAYTALTRADISGLPFRSQSFDLVLATDILFHVVNPRRKGLTWSELARVAKSDEGVAAYSSSHELTSLAVIERLTTALLSSPWFGSKFRDRITMWLTRRCDGV